MERTPQGAGAAAPAVVAHADPAELAARTAERFVRAAGEAIAARGRFVVALAGGETPRRLYEALALPAYCRRIDWERVEILFGDERCVPPGDARSNFGMARRALLAKVPLAERQVHRMRGEDEPSSAAAAYAGELAALFPEAAPARGSWPAIDLVLLGLGGDGHTASLFPRSPALAERGRLAVANWVDALGEWRLTLTAPVLQAARQVWFLVSGASKAETLAAVLTGPRAVDERPSQLLLEARGAVLWLVDRAAAARLPADLARPSDG